MENVFSTKKLEELMLANWTQFLDSSKLMSFVIQNVNKNLNRLSIISSSDIKPKGVSITLSRCSLEVNGFVMWIEFHIPIEIKKTAEGTMEVFLLTDGSISHIDTMGNIYCV